MKKIPTIFLRNPENMREILDEPHPDCAWVFEGEGVATRKYDGTCCMVRAGLLFKRHTVKKGKIPRTDFIEEDADWTTGKRVGWIPVVPGLPENKYHMEAFSPDMLNGTYELVGPKIQGNPEEFASHYLFPHLAAAQFHHAPREFNVLREWLKDEDIEGLVFHHADGRMAKIKKKDFGLTRTPQQDTTP